MCPIFAGSVTYFIGCNHKNLPVPLLKLLKEFLILLHIRYALPVWGLSLLNQQVSHLCHMQNRVVRVVLSLKRFDHVYVPREQIGCLTYLMKSRSVAWQQFTINILVASACNFQ